MGTAYICKPAFHLCAVHQKVYINKVVPAFKGLSQSLLCKYFVAVLLTYLTVVHHRDLPHVNTSM